MASDAKILYQGNRVSAALAFQLAQAGESVPLQVWRDGRQQEVLLPVFPYSGDRAAGYQHESLPRYFVYGGTGVHPFESGLFEDAGAWFRPILPPASFTTNSTIGATRVPRRPGPEPIVLAAVLADAVNANVSIRGRALVDQINGKRIEKLEDVVGAFETNTNAYEVIEFLPNHVIECLDRGATAKANAGHSRGPTA